MPRHFRLKPSEAYKRGREKVPESSVSPYVYADGTDSYRYLSGQKVVSACALGAMSLAYKADFTDVSQFLAEKQIEYPCDCGVEGGREWKAYETLQPATDVIFHISDVHGVELSEGGASDIPDKTVWTTSMIYDWLVSIGL
jgi:hypothetical protein